MRIQPQLYRLGYRVDLGIPPSLRLLSIPTVGDALGRGGGGCEGEDVMGRRSHCPSEGVRHSPTHVVRVLGSDIPCLAWSGQGLSRVSVGSGRVRVTPVSRPCPLLPTSPPIPPRGGPRGMIEWMAAPSSLPDRPTDPTNTDASAG